MKRAVAMLAAALWWGAAAGAPSDGFLCPGDSRLATLVGYYGHAELVRAARGLRSWPAAMRQAAHDPAGITIRESDVFVTNWHEADSGRHCVRRDASGLWVREKRGFGGARANAIGPYVQMARIDEDEAQAYLSLFLRGCFAASDGKRWCFTRRGTTVDGRRFTARFQLDTSELPVYGSTLRVPGAVPPLLVFVPTPQGWAVHADDFVSKEGHVPVVPGRTPPLFTLRRARQAR